jgi:hypothetical protein
MNGQVTGGFGVAVTALPCGQPRSVVRVLFRPGYLERLCRASRCVGGKQNGTIGALQASLDGLTNMRVAANNRVQRAVERENTLGAVVTAFDVSSDMPKASAEATNEVAKASGLSRGAVAKTLSRVRAVGGPVVVNTGNRI